MKILLIIILDNGHDNLTLYLSMTFRVQTQGPEDHVKNRVKALMSHLQQFSKWVVMFYLHFVLFDHMYYRDRSVSKMCTGRRQCKTVLILGLRVLVHPKQSRTFPLHHITIKLAKWTKYEIRSL